MNCTCEKKSGVGDDLVKFDVGVKRNVEVEHSFSQARDDVATHCQQQQREREGHSGRRTSRYADTIPCYAPKTLVFVLHSVRCTAQSECGCVYLSTINNITNN